MAAAVSDNVYDKHSHNHNGDPNTSPSSSSSPSPSPEANSTAVRGKTPGGTESKNGQVPPEDDIFKSGFEVEELYKLALTFFKEKDGSKALHTTYKEKVKLVVLTKQVSFGKYRADLMPDVGFLDVVGNDRKLAWQSLGDMSKEIAMTQFIMNLNNLCPLFAAYVEAHHAEKEEQERKKRDEAIQKEREQLEKMHIQDVAQQQEQDRYRQMSQEVLIRNALNQQTHAQFHHYAEQQCPGDSVQQEALVRQLQEQHFVQYMQQVYHQQQLLQQQYMQQHHEQNSSANAMPPSMGNNAGMNSPYKQQLPTQATPSAGSTPNHVSHNSTPTRLSSGTPSHPAPGSATGSPSGKKMVDGLSRPEDLRISEDGHQDEEDGLDPNDLPPVAAASMWTRKDVREFKESLQNDPESVVKVGSGELVTVRVPTHDDGSCLFWEFATDSYDIGFGVFFEWTVPSVNELSVHVSESSEDDDLDEDGVRHRTDLPDDRKHQTENDPPTDEIIPVYRRDCQDEVYCGSHVYPGRGVYLLKFDNSYSLWRGKTVYYRVYYTR